mmetsp:Transcript_24082/g.39201  ORF Transcript_24082/g.39201 Transcript_24082/m.39201 type:complete len:321 (+) Transcript_24082:249-1211(+)
MSSKNENAQQHKKQKQNDMLLCQPVAPSQPTPAITSTENQQQHRICNECHQSLAAHLFPKKKFAKEPDVDVCRQCRKNQTAKRCKQQPKQNAKQGRKSESGIIRRPNNFGYCDYVDKLFSLKCFPDIVSLKVFTSAKDVSESMASIQAAGQYGLQPNMKKNGSRVKCLCIGDGSTPRTAVLACYLRQWECVSIDPALQEDWAGIQPKGVRGLIGFKGTLEEFMKSQQQGEQREGGRAKQAKYDHLLLLCVHSHARLHNDESIDKIMARYGNVSTTLVSLPCCPTFRSQKDVGRAPDHVYEDDCVFSQCRKVEIWNFAVLG